MCLLAEGPQTPMKITAADLAYYRPANDSRPPSAPDAVSAPVRAVTQVDPFEAEDDAEFDFAAAQRAAAETLRRDQQQMMLAEMADVKAQGSVSVQAAAAAYREFEV